MANNPDRRLDITGSNAVDAATAAMNGWDLDYDRVQRVVVEVELREDESDDGTGSGSSGSNGNGRELKGIKPGTQLHYGLTVLAAADEMKTARELDEAGEYLNHNQWSSVLSRLHQRCLAERERTGRGTANRYEISQHGVAELDRLPDFDPDTVFGDE